MERYTKPVTFDVANTAIPVEENVILLGVHTDDNLRFAKSVEPLQCHIMCPLQWRRNGCADVSNHQTHDCLLKRLFRRRSKKTSKLCVTAFVTDDFRAQRGSSAGNVSIWWRHHVNHACDISNSSYPACHFHLCILFSSQTLSSKSPTLSPNTANPVRI